MTTRVVERMRKMEKDKMGDSDEVGFREGGEDGERIREVIEGRCQGRGVSEGLKFYSSDLR